jgi:hypothetical protein
LCSLFWIILLSQDHHNFWLTAAFHYNFPLISLYQALSCSYSALTVPREVKLSFLISHLMQKHTIDLIQIIFMTDLVLIFFIYLLRFKGWWRKNEWFIWCEPRSLVFLFRRVILCCGKYYLPHGRRTLLLVWSWVLRSCQCFLSMIYLRFCEEREEHIFVEICIRV